DRRAHGSRCAARGSRRRDRGVRLASGGGEGGRERFRREAARPHRSRGGAGKCAFRCAEPRLRKPMVRVLVFFVLVLFLGLGFAWLAERPGDLVITFGGYRYEVTLMMAAVLVVAVVAAVMLLWWILRGLWRSPYAVARYFRARRRDRGYQSLSTGLIAAGAGDAGLARRMGKQAAKLLSSDQEPLLHLLDAQAALLEGDHEAARKKFAAMVEDPEMRLLGLRGLSLEAERMRSEEHTS